MNIAAIIPAIIAEITKRIPDPVERAKVQMELEGKLIEGQLDINKIEATSPNLFVAGWRPAIGWTLAVAIFAKFIGVPLLTWLCTIMGWPTPPELELGELITLIGGMLGLGALRGIEKVKSAK